MSVWLQSESAYYVIAIALLVLGAVLLLRGWVGHRARGVPRCRRCYYNLAGSPTLTCPECGRTHRDERDALRPRRYWKRGVLGLGLAAIGAYALFWPDITQRRSELKEDWYIAVVPTTVWIALLPQLIALLRGEVLRRADQFDPASIKAMARLGAPALPALLDDLRRLPDPETEPHRHYLVPGWVLEEMGAAALPAIFALMDDDDAHASERAIQWIEHNAKLPREALPLLRERLNRELDRKKIDVLRRAIREVEARR